MSEEFKPITTQEEFDSKIQERIRRAEEKAVEPFKDYNDIKSQLTAANEKITGYEATIAKNKTDYETLSGQLTEANGKIKQYETDALKTKLAGEAGLPMEMSAYLKGETEEELKASAEVLAKFTKKSNISPLANLEGGVSGKEPDKTKEAYKEMLKDLTEGE
ncbi:MAG: hypothetical protein MJ086_03440 [Lachnospiraceae bacterium]|nr:hypothetical protein [Lachnospiraceae bacterium]